MSNNNYDFKYQTEDVKKWITVGIDNECIRKADELGHFLKQNRLSTNQIRNVYSEVKRIEMKGEDNDNLISDLVLLKPKLAYAKARASDNTSKALDRLSSFLSDAIDAVVEVKNPDELYPKFKNFTKLFEAILAYHKYYGGR